MPDSYELARLDHHSFEHLANLLALRVLGAGHTSFGPGPDGGRDGYFEGEAPYPSANKHWNGVWYIQSKFHKPHLSTAPQKWLLEQISSELSLFQAPNTRRRWPDNWIIATNIDPSGAPQTGSFDAARALVAAARPALAKRFHIWGGRKILDLLALHPEISQFYADFLTPGVVLTALYDQLRDVSADLSQILRHLVVTRFTDQLFMKLEQAGAAGAAADNRPGIHKLFVDLPFHCPMSKSTGMAAEALATTSSQRHVLGSLIPSGDEWKKWARHPERARVWLVKGGPGQGKSTLGQYLCQIQRAAVILATDKLIVHPNTRSIADEVRTAAEPARLWPNSPRIPVSIELKDYAQWLSGRSDDDFVGVLPFIAARIAASVGQQVQVGTLRRAFSQSRWLFVFDGLDEVPGDVKDLVATEVIKFVDDDLVACSSDALVLCTTRPQGYSGQFATLDSAAVDLVKLEPEHALACARPVLSIDHTEEESRSYQKILEEAIHSPAIAEIMTTPLQSHIMAVVVRDGGRPPERRWTLFSNFYQVIRRREANKRSSEGRPTGSKSPEKLTILLREGDKLLKSLHNRLGFELHARAETSLGAQTSLTRGELEVLVREVVSELQERHVDDTVDTLMEATTERLVLVNTPDSGQAVRFDIRPLQEFFAAEYIYESVSADKLRERLEIIAGDSHWREVVHFLMSGLVENGRQTEVTVGIEVLTRANARTISSHSQYLYRKLALVPLHSDYDSLAVSG